MCNDACIEFGRANLQATDVLGKKVIEVGSLNVNGSLRRIVEELKPSSYIGVDIENGPGVDEVCDATSLDARYGKDCFDLVISTEALEHIKDWRRAISNMKSILRPGGILLLTTRSKGFPYHGYPFDFWRFEPADMEVVLEDLLLEALETDPLAPGVFVKARKPSVFSEKDLAPYEMYSIVTRRRCRNVHSLDIFLLKARHVVRRMASAILPQVVKRYVNKRRPHLSNVWRE